jgi:hypothetical protein
LQGVPVVRREHQRCRRHAWSEVTKEAGSQSNTAVGARDMNERISIKATSPGEAVNLAFGVSGLAQRRLTAAIRYPPQQSIRSL